MPDAIKTCVFCSREGLTKEHLWSNWIRTNLLVNANATSPHKREMGDGRELAWDAPPFTAVVRCVCARCNSTWMNDIETEVQPHLTPMIQGRKRILGTKAQRALARWAFLKVLMFDQWRPDAPVVPGDHYDRFYASGEPPPSARVRVAAYTGGTSLGRYTDRILDLSPPTGGRPVADGYLATFTIHHAVVQVFGHRAGRDLDLAPPGRLANAVSRCPCPLPGRRDSRFWITNRSLELERPTDRATPSRRLAR